MILELLDYGRDKAKHCEDIAEELDLSAEEVKDLIKIEKLQGAPICANCYGYYIPTTIEELQRNRSRLIKHSRALISAAYAADDTIRRLELLNKAKDEKAIAEAVDKMIVKWKARIEEDEAEESIGYIDSREEGDNHD